MIKNNKFILDKKTIFSSIINLNIDDSFEMKRTNKKDGIGTLKFYDIKMINMAIKKIIDKRFKKILELMANIDESDDDPSEGLVFCLDEASKFKRELINKYNHFLKKNQIELINKKIELIEKDAKNKLIAYRLMHSPIFINPNYQMNNNYDENNEIEEERHHSR